MRTDYGRLISPRFRSSRDSAEQTRLLNRTPLARPGDPADIAGAVLYLVQAPYVTGQVLAVDGGWTVSEGQIPVENP